MKTLAPGCFRVVTRRCHGLGIVGGVCLTDCVLLLLDLSVPLRCGLLLLPSPAAAAAAWRSTASIHPPHALTSHNMMGVKGCCCEGTCTEAPSNTTQAKI